MAEVVHVEGLRELQLKLARLPVELQKKALRGALAAAGKQARDAAKALAPIGKGPKRQGGRTVPAGTLKRSALLSFDRRQSNDTQAVYIVTFRRGKKQQKGNRDAYYASWVEFGHRIVGRYKGKYTDYKLRGKGRLHGLTKRRREATGYVPGRRFLTNSFAAGRERYVQTFARVLRARFDEAVR